MDFQGQDRRTGGNGKPVRHESPILAGRLRGVLPWFLVARGLQSCGNFAARFTPLHRRPLDLLRFSEFQAGLTVTSNPQVAGSIPAGRTSYFKHFRLHRIAGTQEKGSGVRVSVRVSKDTPYLAFPCHGYELNELNEIRLSGKRAILMGPLFGHSCGPLVRFTTDPKE